MPYIVEIPKNQISIIVSRKINNSELLSFNFTSINDGNLSRALFVIYKLEGDKKIEYHPNAEEGGSNLNPYAKSFVSKNPTNTNVTAASIPLALTQYPPSR